jgi:hypothetical protein
MANIGAPATKEVKESANPKKFINPTPHSLNTSYLLDELQSSDRETSESAQACLDAWLFGWRVRPRAMPPEGPPELEPRSFRLVTLPASDPIWTHYHSYSRIKADGPTPTTPAEDAPQGLRRRDVSNTALDAAYTAFQADSACRNALWEAAYFRAFGWASAVDLNGRKIGDGFAHDIAVDFTLHLLLRLQEGAFSGESVFHHWFAAVYRNFKRTRLKQTKLDWERCQELATSHDDYDSDEADGYVCSEYDRKQGPAHLLQMSQARNGLNLSELAESIGAEHGAVASCYAAGLKQREAASETGVSPYRQRIIRNDLADAISKDSTATEPIDVSAVRLARDSATLAREQETQELSKKHGWENENKLPDEPVTLQACADQSDVKTLPTLRELYGELYLMWDSEVPDQVAA